MGGRAKMGGRGGMGGQMTAPRTITGLVAGSRDDLLERITTRDGSLARARET
jgi:hypothetical protein